MGEGYFHLWEGFYKNFHTKCPGIKKEINLIIHCAHTVFYLGSAILWLYELLGFKKIYYSICIIKSGIFPVQKTAGLCILFHCVQQRFLLIKRDFNYFLNKRWDFKNKKVETLISVPPWWALGVKKHPGLSPPPSDS